MYNTVRRGPEMKIVIFASTVTICALLFLASCAPGISQEQYDAAKAEVASLQHEIEVLRDTQEQYDVAKAEVASLQHEISVLQGELTSSKEESTALNQDMLTLEQRYEELQADFESLQTNYQRAVEGSAQSTLVNPTWLELKEFLKRDDTDTIPYDIDSFDCDGYAITIRDRASMLSFRCAFVGLDFGETVGHSINAFETTDSGLIYVDCVEHDTVGYVQLGQPYGVISLDVVKSDYIACEGNPGEFWGDLIWRSHNNPFSYDYYINYQQRLEFLRQSIDAYNNAVSEYNSGSAKWSISQLDKWLENLDALGQDLGSDWFEPLGVVESTEVYWN